MIWDNVDIGSIADLASIVGVVGGLLSIWIALRGVRHEQAWNPRNEAEDTPMKWKTFLMSAT